MQIFLLVNAKGVSRALTDSQLTLIRKINGGFIVIICVSLVVVWAILPMVFYDESPVLNRLYTGYVSLVMFSSIVTCVIFGTIFYQLSVLLKPKSEIPMTSAQAVAYRKVGGC